MKNYIYLAITFFSTAIPSVVFSYNNGSTDLGELVSQVPSVLNQIMLLIIGLAVLAFLFGIVKYLFSGSDEAQRKKSKRYMIWGIVGITVMVSVFGLVTLFGSFFGINSNLAPALPSREGYYF